MTSVALATSSFLPRTGGVEEHVRHLAVELRDAGHRVAVWAVDQGDPPAALPGVAVRYLPAPLPASSPDSLANFAATLPGALRAWRRAWRLDRPDVVHVQCFGPNGPWATALAAAHRTPLVVGAHGETFMDEHRVFDTSRIQQAALRLALRRAAAVSACSRYAAHDLARFGYDPAAADIIHNGVAMAEPGPDRAEGLPERYLLGLGRMVRVKGFDLLLRGYADADLDPDLHLVLAGDGPERDALAATARELGIASRVHLPGRLDRRSVVATMRGAEALVVPSRVEAFGIVVLEGLRAGIPVVATSRGGAAEILTDGADGILVDPLDPASLIAALRRVSTDAGLRSQLRATGPVTAASYDWGHVAERVSGIYDRVTRPSS